MPTPDLPLFEAEAPERDAPVRHGAQTVPVLVPLALNEAYTYLAPDGEVSPGDFVVVPLGPMKRIGVVWREADGARKPVDPKKLKAVIEKLDVPPLPAINLAFADWVAHYTLAPKGMVLQMMMSARLIFEAEEPRWGFRLGGMTELRLTEARKKVLAALQDGEVWAKKKLMDAAGVSAAVIDGLAEAGALIRAELPRSRPFFPRPDFAFASLTEAQTQAAGILCAAIAKGGFSSTLLDGVTGSGKTEVYFEAVAEALRRGRAAGSHSSARNRADEPVSGALRGALRMPPRRMAFRRLSKGARPDMARRCRGRRARRLRRPVGALPTLRRSRPHRRGRGARLLLQAGRPRHLSGARYGRGPRLARQNPDRAEFRDAVGRKRRECAPRALCTCRSSSSLLREQPSRCAGGGSESDAARERARGSARPSSRL